jgi:hypothetical protein
MTETEAPLVPGRHESEDGLLARHRPIHTPRIETSAIPAGESGPDRPNNVDDDAAGQPAMAGAARTSRGAEARAGAGQQEVVPRGRQEDRIAVVLRENRRLRAQVPIMAGETEISGSGSGSGSGALPEKFRLIMEMDMLLRIQTEHTE